MSTFTLPLQNIPQSFQMSLAGVDYQLTCKWNDSDEGGWALDISDSVTSEPIAANISLVTGVNLLDGLGYLGINGELFVYTDGDQNAVPTLDNLGVESNVYFVTEVEDGE